MKSSLLIQTVLCIMSVYIFSILSHKEKMPLDDYQYYYSNSGMTIYTKWNKSSISVKVTNHNNSDKVIGYKPRWETNIGVALEEHSENSFTVRANESYTGGQLYYIPDGYTREQVRFSLKNIKITDS